MARFRITYTRMDDMSMTMTEMVTIIEVEAETPDEVYDKIRTGKITSVSDGSLKEVNNLKRSWVKRIERL